MASDVGKTNTFKVSELKDFINRIENVDKEIASETGSFMAGIKTLKNDKKEIFAEAKDAGIPLKALKAELKLRALDRDKAKVVAGLEEDDRECLELIQEKLGDLASTPLGAAAMKAAEARA